MNHCIKCGNNIPDDTTTCEDAGFSEGCGRTMNEKECCEECLKCPDYTKHDFCHNKSCACHTPQEKEPWEKESLAHQLHDWYLEATSQEDAKYNYEAVVPYEDLPEGSKLIDRYIAEKVLSLLASERADLIKSVEKCKPIFERAGKVPTEKEPWEFVNKIASYLRCDCDECRGAIEKHIKSLLDTQRADWLRSEIEKLEGMKKESNRERHPELEKFADDCECFSCSYADSFNTALTSIITRCKEELKELTRE